ncbi:hypothetical protein O6H91_09G108300 [Diphasiastrum complanatum]|uniref:Uncharacterized protein n=1 Tax=Diphasiastrum complanatum TaxID=34168 RepID=A0ACC2CST2_DIPCM|nr:hypothetical protein O6H91_09G108300 [Diphasiastrum complanatum]
MQDQVVDNQYSCYHQQKLGGLIKNRKMAVSDHELAIAPCHLIYKRDEIIANHHNLFISLWQEGFRPQERTEDGWVVYILGGKLNPPVEVSLPCDISTTAPRRMQAFLRKAGKNFMCKWEVVADNWTDHLPLSAIASVSEQNVAPYKISEVGLPGLGLYQAALPSQFGGQCSKSIPFLDEQLLQHNLAEALREEEESDPSVNYGKSNERIYKLRRQQKPITI